MEVPDAGWAAEVDIDIDAPPETVWNIVSDFSRHPELAGSGEVLAVRMHGPLRVGTVFESDLRVGEVGTFSPTCEVNEVDEPRRLGWISRPPLDDDETPAHQIEVFWAFALAASATGTSLRHTVHIPPPRAGAEELATFFERTDRLTAVRAGMQQTAENIKALAETPGSPTLH